MGTDTRNSGRELGAAECPPDIEYRIGEDERSSHAVVTAVAAALDRRPEEVPPLHDTIDLDALETLFEPRYDGTPRTGARVTFAHSECEVVVDSERVQVYRNH